MLNLSDAPVLAMKRTAVEPFEFFCSGLRLEV
jgi:hypothetical protein